MSIASVEQSFLDLKDIKSYARNNWTDTAFSFSSGRTKQDATEGQDVKCRARQWYKVTTKAYIKASKMIGSNYHWIFYIFLCAECFFSFWSIIISNAVFPLMNIFKMLSLLDRMQIIKIDFNIS